MREGCRRGSLKCKTRVQSGDLIPTITVTTLKFGTMGIFDFDIVRFPLTNDRLKFGH